VANKGTKTVTAAAVLLALEELGFEDFVVPVRSSLDGPWAGHGGVAALRGGADPATTRTRTSIQAVG
jgi:hypothetical protein